MIDTCPLCGGQTLELALTCKDWYASGETFEVVRCAQCGFLMTQNAPVEAEIGRYYESPDYISHTNTRKGLTNSLYHVVRRFMLARKASLVMNSARLKKGRLLDYGTGTGFFPHTMKQKGWQVCAIDKSQAARDFARQRFGLNVESEDALQSYTEGSFDVVTLWHVMEHLEHLDDMWDTIHRLLKKHGTLIVAVPNPDSYDAQKYQEYWAAYDVPRHLWHFTPSTIMQWGEKHGFVLERQYTMPFDGFYISMLSEQYKGSRLHTIKGFWNGFKGWIAQWKRRSASSSIIYVFRKKR